MAKKVTRLDAETVADFHDRAKRGPWKIFPAISPETGESVIIIERVAGGPGDTKIKPEDAAVVAMMLGRGTWYG